MKTPEAILKELNISKQSLLSAKDNGAELLENFGLACMEEALKQAITLSVQGMQTLLNSLK